MFGDGGGVCCSGFFEDIGFTHCVRVTFPHSEENRRRSFELNERCRTDQRPFPDSLLLTLLASLQGLLNGQRILLWDVAAQVLGSVLGTKQFRLAVWEEGRCMSG